MQRVLDFLQQLLTYPLLTVSGTAISFTSILIFFGLAWLSFFLAGKGRTLVHRLLEGKLEPTIASVLDQIVYVVGVAAGFYVALDFIGINISGLVVLAGALGVGIGFGLQNIASNLISGVIILLERPISVGDRVTVGDTIGDVRSIGLRSTEIVTPDNIMIIVPNTEFVSSRVTNWTRGQAQTRVRLPVGVAYGSDLDRVRRALLEVADHHPNVLATPAPEVWLVNFGDSAINLELLVWVASPNLIPRLRSELNFGVEAALRRYGLTIPFPQRDVYLKIENGNGADLEALKTLDAASRDGNSD